MAAQLACTGAVVMEKFEKLLTTVITCILLGWLLGLGLRMAGIR